MNMKFNTSTNTSKPVEAPIDTFDTIAEWAGLHYKKNWDGESPEGKRELLARYCETHSEAHEDFDRVTVQRDNVQVSLIYLDEGVNGDFNSDDPEDEPLVRVDVMAKPGLNWASSNTLNDSHDDGWFDLHRGSFCTNINANLPEDALKGLAHLILEQVYPKVSQGESAKRLFEDLSNAEVSWLVDGVPEQIGRQMVLDDIDSTTPTGLREKAAQPVTLECPPLMTNPLDLGFLRGMIREDVISEAHDAAMTILDNIATVLIQGNSVPRCDRPEAPGLYLWSPVGTEVRQMVKVEEVGGTLYATNPKTLISDFAAGQAWWGPVRPAGTL